MAIYNSTYSYGITSTIIAAFAKVMERNYMQINR